MNLIQQQVEQTRRPALGFNATASARNRNQTVFGTFLSQLTTDESKKLPTAKALGLPTAGLIIGGQRDFIVEQKISLRPRTAFGAVIARNKLFMMGLVATPVPSKTTGGGTRSGQLDPD